MPITPSRIASDPQAPLAWNTTVVVVALEKLRRLRPIKQKERIAIETVAEQLDRLTETSQLRIRDVGQGEVVPLPPSFHDSFFTLVAIGDKTSPIGKPPLLEKAGAYLHSIAEHLDSGKPAALDSGMLREAQDVCLQLLEHLNKQRPNTPVR